MGDALWKRLQLLVSVLSIILLLIGAGLGWGRWYLHGSLPRLDGDLSVPGLGHRVEIERDALGVPTISGVSRNDVAYATGFLHAQDRFFQMDLLRRNGAGELAELVGLAALPLDQAHRLHGFRRAAAAVLADMSGDPLTLLEAYTAGVNAGLAALPRKPWEYLILQSTPKPWRPEDSILVIYAMWFELQDSTGRQEQSLDALRRGAGRLALDFLAPWGNSWDAALDGSQLPTADLPSLRLRPSSQSSIIAASPERELPGSNAFAVSGNHTKNGAALLANDMHLSLGVPNNWYRAVLRWTGPDEKQHRLVGVTLPGLPGLVAGSNGSLAWGFTTAQIDTSDVVVVETENIAQSFYRTAHGYTEIEDRPETIRIKGGATAPFVARWTEWGPILSGPVNGRYLALRWNAHDPKATNLNLLGLETARSVEEAVAIAHQIGMPNSNLVVADSEGNIAWTLTGLVPRRFGFDGRLPVTWGYGDRRWDGWLDPAELPTSISPAEGILWAANNRMVGGEMLDRLGDGGYVEGARAGMIRDGLRALVAPGGTVSPPDLLAIQLDDQARYLERWQKFLLEVLTPAAVAQKPTRGELREAVTRWTGRAEPDSAAYRLVRSWHRQVKARTLEPFLASATAFYPALDYHGWHVDDALWQLTHARPENLLNPKFSTWNDLLLAAVDDVLAEADREGLAPAKMTWGRSNRLRMRHPLSRSLPALLTHWLDLPIVPLPGGSNMPRVQTADFGASERLVVAPGHENEGLFHMPGGQSAHPLSPFFRAGHSAWVTGGPTSLLPGPAEHTLVLQPQ